MKNCAFHFVPELQASRQICGGVLEARWCAAHQVTRSECEQLGHIGNYCRAVEPLQDHYSRSHVQEQPPQLRSRSLTMQDLHWNEIENFQRLHMFSGSQDSCSTLEFHSLLTFILINTLIEFANEFPSLLQIIFASVRARRWIPVWSSMRGANRWTKNQGEAWHTVQKLRPLSDKWWTIQVPPNTFQQDNELGLFYHPFCEKIQLVVCRFLTRQQEHSHKKPEASLKFTVFLRPSHSVDLPLTLVKDTHRETSRGLRPLVSLFIYSSAFDPQQFTASYHR